MSMRKASRVWFMALLPVLFAAGCGLRERPPSPALQSISPDRGLPGQTVTVTLTGTSFVYGSEINVDEALISVSDLELVNSTLITARFTVAANAAPGPVNISVSTYGVTTNALTFTIAPSGESSGH